MLWSLAPDDADYMLNHVGCTISFWLGIDVFIG
jgi:hypothetical protein